jgi:hypothetical protein
MKGYAPTDNIFTADDYRKNTEIEKGQYHEKRKKNAIED